MYHTATIEQQATLITLTCPSAQTHDANIQAIYGRGNLPLLIGNDVLAEITCDDLEESWHTALSLSERQLNSMCRRAAHALGAALQEPDSADLTEMVTEAAALFLLAMRRYGVFDTNRIPPCIINWTSPDLPEQIMLLA